MTRALTKPKAEGNPEGKGVNGFLLDWYATTPRGVVAKPDRQLLADRKAGFVGTCVLQPDMTWTITPSGQLADSAPLQDALRAFYLGFAEMLDTDLKLEELLPFYARRVAYYPRLLANALSRSVSASNQHGGRAGISSRQWSALLPQSGHALLALDG